MRYNEICEILEIHTRYCAKIFVKITTYNPKKEKLIGSLTATNDRRLVGACPARPATEHGVFQRCVGYQISMIPSHGGMGRTRTALSRGRAPSISLLLLRSGAVLSSSRSGHESVRRSSSTCN